MLWQYALSVYADPAVARACLQAQDALGVDVNLLLCAAWCATQGRRLDQTTLGQLDEQCRSWRELIITSLRRQRRQWKEDPERINDYESLKRLEITAEREQLLRLEAQLGELTASAAETDVLRANVVAVFEFFGSNGAAASPLATALESGLTA
jgi:uncharacterized protein (TIGR02444 family)